MRTAITIALGMLVACSNDMTSNGDDGGDDEPPMPGTVTARAALAGTVVWFHDSLGNEVAHHEVTVAGGEVSAEVLPGAYVSFALSAVPGTLTVGGVRPGDTIVYARATVPAGTSATIDFPADRAEPQPTRYRVRTCDDGVGDIATQPASGDRVRILSATLVDGCDVIITNDAGRALVVRDVAVPGGVVTVEGTFAAMPSLELAMTNIPAQYSQIIHNYFVGESLFEDVEVAQVTGGATTIAIPHPPDVAIRRELELRGNAAGTGALAIYQWRDAPTNEALDVGAIARPGGFVQQPVFEVAAGSVTWQHDRPSDYALTEVILEDASEHEWRIANAWTDGAIAIPTLQGLGRDPAAHGLAGLRMQTVEGGYAAIRASVFDFATQSALLEPGANGQRFELKLNAR